MKAILKEIEVLNDADYELIHPIKLFFVESKESDEVYSYVTTIETQFCTKGEFDLKKGMTHNQLTKRLDFANSFIGKTFEINLFKITVKELTNNKYVAFELTIDDGFCCYEETVEYYNVASYMTKEDLMLYLKYSITRQSIDGLVYGILPDESTEEITTELFFPKPIPEKKYYNIPYDKYHNLNSNYIVNEIPVNDISKGRNLAYQIKDRDLPEHEFDRYVHEIENYRSKVRAAQMENESLRKKLFFWEPKVVVEELKLSANVISLMKDCFILGKEYPLDCDKADIEYAEECEKQLREKYLGEDADEKVFKNKLLEFRQSLSKKYKGKEVIQILN